MKRLLTIVLSLAMVSGVAFADGPISFPAGGGGGSSLPSQTGNSGKYLTTDGSSASWNNPAGSGDVTGGATSVSNEMATYNGTGGKTIQRSLFVLAGPSSTAKTYTFPNSNATIWTNLDNGVVGPVGGSTDTYFAYWDGATGRLLKDGQSSVNPAFSTINVYGANALNLGTAGTYAGQVRFKSAGSAVNYFPIIAPATFTDNVGWVLPAGAPGGANYLLNTDADGTMGYTDPATFAPSSSTSTATDWNKWDGGATGLTAATGRTSLGLAGMAVIDNGTMTNTKSCIFTAGTGIVCNTTPAAGGGDFSGPASSTDNAVVLFDGTGGKTGKNSGITLGSDNTLTIPGGISTGAGTDGQRRLTLGNNTAFSPTASVNEIYFEGNILKVNENGTERTPVKTSDIGTLVLAPDGSAASLTSFPTLNQNTSGTAANVSGTPALPNGTTATRQAADDATDKLATDNWVITQAYAKINRTKAFPIIIDNVVAADNVLLFRAPVALTLTRADCYASVDNVIGSLMECSTSDVTSCTVLDSWTVTNAVNPFSDTSMTDGAVAAGAWIRWSTTSVGTASLNRLTCTVQYNE